LKISAISTQPVAETLRVAGSIEFDEQRIARIGATVTGRVTQIDALLGQEVKKGEVLARLNSSELSNQQLAYLKARAQLELNRRNAERAKALFQADVIGAAELQRRESEYQISLAETRAASDQLQLLGVSAASIERLSQKGAVDSVTPVVATLGGVVVERKLAAGQVVQPADALFVVADLSRLWAVAQVPEQQVSQVKTGQSVSIEVPALGNEKLVGKLIFVGQTINPETRTVLVRTELDNRDGRLKPAMLASMLIEAKPVDRLVVPAGAVVRADDEDHVFVATGEGHFRLTKVKLGPEQGGKRVVLSGLKGEEQVVSEGAFHLNNERNRKEMEGT
jgi:cobalt-zinc-cadmium efflux system membrane fusion protein